MRFEILGPLLVKVRNREVVVTAGRERALLAALLLSANRVVPVAELVDGLWTERLPRDARSQIHGCVSRLRRRLAASTANEIITTEPAGYRLRASPKTVDLLEFRALVTAARIAAREGHWDEARDAYRRALGLWRGPALAGIDQDAIQQAAAGLEEERAQALQERIDVELMLGADAELISELTELVHRYPYRERLHGALMLALYRADRQADALDTYQRARRHLIAELGQEPGPALQTLHQRILTGDPDLRLVSPPPIERRADLHHRAASHCLPRTVADFTGREADLAWLLDTAERADPYAPLVVTLDGMPGVGKTSLAVHAAHLLAPRYPDGQLFLDLHGHSEQQPVAAETALDALLRQLGLPANQIPDQADERTARWRAELAGRRVLVVLDNAASSTQVAPLLPTGPGCLALVTSRRRLLDLDGVRPRSVETLDPETALVLLARIAGRRIHDEPDAAAEVAKRCGHLPLALRLAAARLAHRPGWQVHDLADRLSDASRSLTELTAGDRTVADAFALSYEHLHPATQGVFRRLGLHPGEHFDACAAAALAGISRDQAQRCLDELVDSHLVQEPLAYRYRLHDIVKRYAATLVDTAESAAERDTAIQGLLDYYLHAVSSVCIGMETENSRRGLRHRQALRPDLVTVAGDRDSEWLETELPNVTAAIRQAAALGHHQYAWQIARAMSRYLFRRGHLHDLVTTHRLGLAAAEQLGDLDGAAGMHTYLAGACYRNANYDDALWHIRRAWALREQLGDHIGAATAQGNTAVVLAEAGRHREAAREYEQMLATARRAGNAPLLATAVTNAGEVYFTLGRYEESAVYSRRGLALARHNGDLGLVTLALANLGRARARLGQPGPALRLLQCALRLRRRASDNQPANERHAESETLNDLGTVYRALGEFDTATAHHMEALAVAREAGFRQNECAIDNELGRTRFAAGDLPGALAAHQRALALAGKIRHKYHEAQALDGIANCLRSSDPASARQHWHQALQRYRELEMPELDEVERRLRELDAQAPPGLGGTGGVELPG